jgi:hypothetical protein
MDLPSLFAERGRRCATLAPPLGRTIGAKGNRPRRLRDAVLGRAQDSFSPRRKRNFATPVVHKALKMRGDKHRGFSTAQVPEQRKRKRLERLLARRIGFDAVLPGSEKFRPQARNGNDPTAC